MEAVKISSSPRIIYQYRNNQRPFSLFRQSIKTIQRSPSSLCGDTHFRDMRDPGPDRASLSRIKNARKVTSKVCPLDLRLDKPARRIEAAAVWQSKRRVNRGLLPISLYPCHPGGGRDPGSKATILVQNYGTRLTVSTFLVRNILFPFILKRRTSRIARQARPSRASSAAACTSPGAGMPSNAMLAKRDPAYER